MRLDGDFLYMTIPMDMNPFCHVISMDMSKKNGSLYHIHDTGMSYRETIIWGFYLAGNAVPMNSSWV